MMPILIATDRPLPFPCWLWRPSPGVWERCSSIPPDLRLGSTVYTHWLSGHCTQDELWPSSVDRPFAFSYEDGGGCFIIRSSPRAVYEAFLATLPPSLGVNSEVIYAHWDRDKVVGIPMIELGLLTWGAPAPCFFSRSDDIDWTAVERRFLEV